MTRYSPSFSLVLAPLLACTGDKDPAPADTGVDVSDLGCAGLTDEDGEVVVPTQSTNGCTGASVTGEFVGGLFDPVPGQTLEVTVLIHQGASRLREYACRSSTVEAQGRFDLGGLAPAWYGLYFRGTLETTGDWVETFSDFEVCSDAVHVEADLGDVQGETDTDADVDADTDTDTGSDTGAARR